MLVYLGLYNKKNKSSSILRSSVIFGFKIGLGVIKNFFHICMSLTLNIYLQLHNKTGLILCVTSRHMKSCMQHVLIIWIVEVTYHLHIHQQLIHWSFFVTLLFSSAYGYKCLRQTMFGVVMHTKKMNELFKQISLITPEPKLDYFKKNYSIS